MDSSSKFACVLLAATAVLLGVYIRLNYSSNSPPSSSGDKKISSKKQTAARSKKGDTSRSRVNSSELSEANQNEAERLRTLGNKVFGKGDYEQAIELYTQAIAKSEITTTADKDNVAKCYGNRAYCHLKLHQNEEAIIDCTKALKFDPKYIKALQRRGSALELLERYEEALEDHLLIMKLISPTAAADPSSITKQQQDQMALIDKILQRLATKKAAKCVEEKQGQFANSTIIKTYLKTFKENQITESIKTLKDNLENVPIDDVQASNYAKIKLANKYVQECVDLHEALKLYVDVSTNDASNYNGIVGKATLLHLCGRIDESLEAFKAAKALKNNDINMLVKHANALLFKSAIEEAVDELNLALKVDPNSTIALFHAGEAATVQGKHEEAIEYYAKCVDIDSSLYEAYNHQGLAYMAIIETLGEHSYTAPHIIESAEKTLTKAIEVAPDQPEAYNNYGLFLRLINQNDKADKQFDKALEVDKENATAYTRKGFILLQAEGNVYKALENFDKAIQLDMYNIEAYCNKAITYLTMNKADDAIDCYEKAIQYSGVLSLDLPRIFYYKETAVMQKRFTAMMAQP